MRTTTMLTFRELPPEEWPTLVEQGIYPYAAGGLPPDNGHWRILVAERDDEIVGCTALHTQVHFDPWYLRPGVGAAEVRGLVRAGRDLLASLGIDHAYCTIDDTQILTRDQAERLGFVAAPGQLYLLDLDQLKEF